MSETILKICDNREEVYLSFVSGTHDNVIDDEAGEGDLKLTWSADKLVKEFTDRDEQLSLLDDLKVNKEDGMGLSETSFSQVEKDKLNDIEVEATKNALDSFLLDRSNHTNTQPQNTVEGLVERLNAIEESITSLGGDSEELVEELLRLQQDVVLNSTNISTLTERVGELEVKVGNHIIYADNRFTTVETNHNILDNKVDVLSERVDKKVDKVAGKQLSSEDYTKAEKTKLSGIASGATKNSTDTQLRDRKTHTGVQPISSVDGLSESLNSLSTSISNKVDKSEVSVTSSPNKVLMLDDSGMVDSSVLPPIAEETTLGFGLSTDSDGGVQLGYEIPNTENLTHGVDLSTLKDAQIFAIGREFDQYGLLTKGIAFLKDNTFIREGQARVSVKKGNGTLEYGRAYTEDEVKMMCSIGLDAPMTSITTGEGRTFVVWNFNGSQGFPAFKIDRGVYAFDQNYEKQPHETNLEHESKVVVLKHLNNVVGDINGALEEVLGDK